MKKILSSALIITLLCSVLSMFSGCALFERYDAKDEYFGYDLKNDGTFEISALDPDNMPFDVVIPSSFDGIAVSEIAKNGFKDCKQIISVTIPGSIRVINARSFKNCESLATVYLGHSGGYLRLKGFIFKGCEDLEYLEFEGTRKIWNKNVRKSWFWNSGNGAPFSVICSDD